MNDEDEIRSLIGEHFGAMHWELGVDPDWDRFRQDFLSGAQLFGAARPVQARTVDGFIERMETVVRNNLHSFEEHTGRMRILRFGNVAVVMAMSELLEDGLAVNHDISGHLLIKSEGRWPIAAHAWDQAGEDNPVPEELR